MVQNDQDWMIDQAKGIDEFVLWSSKHISISSSSIKMLLKNSAKTFHNYSEGNGTLRRTHTALLVGRTYSCDDHRTSRTLRRYLR